MRHGFLGNHMWCVYRNRVECTYSVTLLDSSLWTSQYIFKIKSFFFLKLSMPRLSKDQCRAGVRMLMNGSSQHNVARHFRVHKSTISVLFDRLSTTGTINDRLRPGRPRVATRREDTFIRVAHPRHRFQTPDQTARTLRGLNNTVFANSF